METRFAFGRQLGFFSFKLRASELCPRRQVRQMQLSVYLEVHCGDVLLDNSGFTHRECTLIHRDT